MGEAVMQPMEESIPCPPKIRRSVKSSNWHAERKRWHELHDLDSSIKPPSPFVRSRTHHHRKPTISERQRLRKAGDLVAPQINSFDHQPPVAHRVKTSITFSHRQRLRKRGVLNKLSVTEDECFDAFDQLFPGARVDYSPPESPHSLFDSLKSDYQKSWHRVQNGLSWKHLHRRKRGEESSNLDNLEQAADGIRKKNVVPEFLAQYGSESDSASEKDEAEEADEGTEEEKETRYRFRLKLGSAGRRLLSGAIAGAFSRTAVAPLETIRTHMMVGSHGHSLTEVFDWIMSNEGWTGLFRGNTINVIRVAPSKAIELFVFDQVKGFLSPKDGKPGKLASLPVSPVAGSCAGISSTICMYPLELLKTRLTIQPGEYRGILHAFWRIVTEEGILELYRGLGPSIIGVIPYAGVNYYAYDSLRSLYKRVTKEDRVGNIQTLLIGSLAGAIASTSTFPLEVARKQMQVGALKGRVVYTSTLDALRGIAKERGIGGLYRGLGPSCLKLMPAAGLSFMCYEALKRVLLEEEQVAA